MNKNIIFILTAFILVLSAFSVCFADEVTTYKVGICNYVDHEALNAAVSAIESTLAKYEEENPSVHFEVYYDNAQADANVLSQIVTDFISRGVDIMVGVATPVAMNMQADTEDNQIPVVFAAVSDPVSAGLVESWDVPGSNITGASDFLDTGAMMNLIIAADPDVDNVALLYDLGQDSSTTAIADAKVWLDEKGIAWKEYTGTTTDELQLACQSIVADGMDAVFTPSDNTVMYSESALYEILAEAGIPHYGGSDSFALSGAFLGFGINYSDNGVAAANMVIDILVNGADPATMPVSMLDNGIATINTEICEQLGYDFDAIVEAFTPYSSAIKTVVTADPNAD